MNRHSGLAHDRGMSQTRTDQARRLENVLNHGVIAAVDHATAMVRVELAGGRLTDWLPVPAEIGANFRRWRPLRIGTPVTLGSVSGDPGNARILQTFYSAAHPAPADLGTQDLIEYDDGTRIAYDSAEHRLTVEAVGAVTVRAREAITAESEVEITAKAPRLCLIGDLEIQGKVEIQGDVHATGSILSDGANSNHHRH